MNRKTATTVSPSLPGLASENTWTGTQNFNGPHTRFGGPLVFNIGTTFTFDTGVATLLRTALSLAATGNAQFGNLTLTPSASRTPASNGDLVIQTTSDTEITFKLKGSDGTVRSGSITLS